MSLRQYIANAERTYKYRIKAVVPLEDDAMGRIEHALLKYKPLHLGQPRRLMFQATVLDFPNVQNAEVNVVDIELGLPASPYVLQDEIHEILGLPKKFVVVRGENDPLERRATEAEARAEMDEAAEKAGEDKGALLNLSQYEEGPEHKGEDLYGDAHNRRLLGYLKGVEKDRSDKAKVDAPNAPFKWLDMPGSDVDADAGPTIGSETPKDNADISGQQNLDDERKPYVRAYAKKGKTYVKRTAADAIRKDA